MAGFWKWIPGSSIGPFVFGEEAGPVIQELRLQKRPRNSSVSDWDTYEYPGFESWISTENDQIASVHCEDSVEYNGTNLLGVSATEVRQILGKEDQREDEVGLGYALYYDRLGLTLFVVDDLVDAAACNPILANDEEHGEGGDKEPNGPSRLPKDSTRGAKKVSAAFHWLCTSSTPGATGCRS